MFCSMFCSPGVNVFSLCFYRCIVGICFHVPILKGVPIFCLDKGVIFECNSEEFLCYAM